MEREEFRIFCHDEFVRRGFKKRKQMYYLQGKGILCGLSLQKSIAEAYYINCDCFIGDFSNMKSYPSMYDSDYYFRICVLSKDIIYGEHFMEACIEYKLYTQEELRKYFDKAFEEHIMPIVVIGKEALLKEIEINDDLLPQDIDGILKKFQISEERDEKTGSCAGTNAACLFYNGRDDHVQIPGEQRKSNDAGSDVTVSGGDVNWEESYVETAEAAGKQFYGGSFANNLRKMVLCFFQEEKISAKCKDEMLSFLEGKETKQFLNKQNPTSVFMKKTEKEMEDRFLFLKELYEKRTAEYEQERMDRNTKENHDMFAVNEEKYVKEFYERTKFFGLLHQLFTERPKEFMEESEAKVWYKRYEKLQARSVGYHCPSPVKDLVNWDMIRRAVSEKMPKDRKNVVEYDYDEKGRLIMIKGYGKNAVKNFTEILLYEDAEVYRIKYQDCKGENIIQKIGIQKYEGVVIHSYEDVCFFRNKPLEINKETYHYEDEELKISWESGLIFPDLLCPRISYTYERDENGLIKCCQVKEFWGDGEKKYPCGERVIEIPLEKRMDTGKNAGRWQRPSYFAE